MGRRGGGSATAEGTARVRSTHVHPVLATALVAVLGYVALALVVVGFGLFLTEVLLDGALGRWDGDVTAWLVERRTPARDDLSLLGSYFAETVTVAVVLVVALGVLAWTRRWRECALVVVAMAVEAATYVTATYLVERHRPNVPRLEDLIVADSYFSGHAAAAVAMYGSLAIVVWSLTRRPALRALIALLAVGAPLAVALSRMYRGMHFASDVTTGVFVGLGAIAVARFAVRAGSVAAARRRDEREVLEHRSPQPAPVVRGPLVREVAR